MRKVLFVLGLTLAAPLAAQTIATLPSTCAPGPINCVQATPVVNPDGTNIGGGGGGGVVTQGTASNLNAQVVGNSASGATDSGNPVKIGAKYNTTLPIYTDGQRGDLQINTRGQLMTILSGTNSTSGIASVAANVDAASANNFGLQVGAYNMLFNGSTWDRARGDTAGAYNVLTPTASANNAVVGTASAAAESGRVLKASAGNVYSVSITTGGSAGYLMLFNATTVPADGAVTPVMCRVVAANSTLTVSSGVIPQRYTTGISAAFSTTGCFTKTASATAYIEGYVL